MNRSCPDINDKEATTNTIFTIKEEKEDMINTIKFKSDKETEKKKFITQLRSKERIGNNSVVKSSSKNSTADKPRIRPSSGVNRSNYYSNYGTGKTKFDEEKKPTNPKRLSIPRDIKNYTINDSKQESKRSFATPAENKEKISKLRTVNSNIKNKLKEITKAATSKKKDYRSINIFLKLKVLIKVIFRIVLLTAMRILQHQSIHQFQLRILIQTVKCLKILQIMKSTLLRTLIY